MRSLLRISGLILFQVTFVSSESVPPEFSHSVRFGNITYNLYSHSFLQFGQVFFISISNFKQNDMCSFYYIICQCYCFVILRLSILLYILCI